MVKQVKFDRKVLSVYKLFSEMEKRIIFEHNWTHFICDSTLAFTFMHVLKVHNPLITQINHDYRTEAALAVFGFLLRNWKIILGSQSSVYYFTLAL